jgi:predicted O-methyltransferase YrrM
VKAVLRRAAERAPNLGTAFSVYVLLRRQTARYAAAGADERPVEELFRQTDDERLLEIEGHDLIDVRVGTGAVVASQKYRELMPFLQRVGRLRPRRLCEIGSSAGGTVYALTRVAAPDAVIVSVDIAIPPPTRLARSRLARANQRVISVEGDSHAERTKNAVRHALGGEQLDVLFIDGDHSYDGVRADFELYSELVRPGGIIGLHDINEDFATRHGVPTDSVSGDVPRFWRELKEQHKTEELVADPEQDGYGIGIVYR